MRLVVLEPLDIMPPFASVPVAEQGPAAHAVWETQQGSAMVIPEEARCPLADVLRSQGRTSQESGVLAAADDRARSRRRAGFRQPFPGALHRRHRRVHDPDRGSRGHRHGQRHQLEQAQRYQHDLLDERDRLQFLLDVNNLLVSHLDHRSLLEAIVKEPSRRVIDADLIGVGLCVKDSGQVRLDFGTARRAASSRPMSPFHWIDPSPA